MASQVLITIGSGRPYFSISDAHKNNGLMGIGGYDSIDFIVHYVLHHSKAYE